MKFFGKVIFLLFFLQVILQKDGCYSSAREQKEENLVEEINLPKSLLQLPRNILYSILMQVEPWEVRGILLSSVDSAALFNEDREIWTLWMKKWRFKPEENSSPISFIKGRILCLNAFIAALQYTLSPSCEDFKIKSHCLLQKAIEHNDSDALSIRKSEFLKRQQFDVAREINEKLCERRSIGAIESKLNALKDQQDPLYEVNFDLLRTYIDKIWAWHIPLALTIKIEGLSCGRWGYLQNLPEARKIIEEEIKQGNHQALLLKMEGLGGGKYGYSQDFVATRLFIEQDENLKYSLFLRHYIDALCSRTYGYDKNKTKAKIILEEQLSKQNSDAFVLVIEALGAGLYGYKVDLELRQKMIDIFSEKNLPSALTLKIEGLCQGKYGYPLDIAKAIDFLKTMNPAFVNISEMYEKSIK